MARTNSLLVLDVLAAADHPLTLGEVVASAPMPWRTAAYELYGLVHGGSARRTDGGRYTTRVPRVSAEVAFDELLLTVAFCEARWRLDVLRPRSR
jgi:DNA-binding IclR family transcriptional regulator